MADVLFSDIALAEVAGLGPTQITALVRALRNINNHKVEQAHPFRCTWEGQMFNCQLRVSSSVPGADSQILYATLNNRLLVLGFTEPELSAGYDLGAIAESLEVLGATNWFEKGLRVNLSSLRDEMVVLCLVGSGTRAEHVSAKYFGLARYDEIMDWRRRPEPLNWHGRKMLGYHGIRSAFDDPFLTKDSAELVHRLMTEQLRTPEPRIVDNPVLVNRLRQLSERAAGLANGIVTSARRWLSKPARDKFKELMDAAITQPQVVERGDDEIIIMSKRLLQNYADPKSALSIVEFFRQPKANITALEITEIEHADRDEFSLSKPQ